MPIGSCKQHGEVVFVERCGKCDAELVRRANAYPRLVKFARLVADTGSRPHLIREATEILCECEEADDGE